MPAKKKAPPPKPPKNLTTAPAPAARPVTTSAPAPTDPPLVGDAPAVGAPSPPKGFLPIKGGYRGLRATDQQVFDAADVAHELEQPSYASDFPRAPDPVLMGEALVQAQSWSNQAAAADAWAAYVHEMRDRAWDAALTRTGKLAPKFKDALNDDASLRGKYPQTSNFLATRATIAARSVATRKKNRATATTATSKPADPGTKR